MTARPIRLNEPSSRVMRFLIWLVILCLTIALLRRAVAWMLRRFVNSFTRREVAPDQPHTVGSRRLVRDPICGVHVAEERAIPLRTGGEVLHFCSAACRDQYAANEQNIAAHG
jgi:YHS domain-containing protein